MSTSTIGECAGGRLPQVYPKDDWQELAWDRQMSEWFGSVCVMSFNVGPQTSTRVDKCVHRTLLVSTLKKNKTCQNQWRYSHRSKRRAQLLHNSCDFIAATFTPFFPSFPLISPFPTFSLCLLLSPPFCLHPFYKFFLFSLLPSFLPSLSFPSLSLFILP